MDNMGLWRGLSRGKFVDPEAASGYNLEDTRPRGK